MKIRRFSNIHSWIEDRALALGGQRDRDRGEVGRERRPRAVLDLRLVLADVALRRSSFWPPGTSTSSPSSSVRRPRRCEDEADHPQVVGLGVLDAQLAAGDAGERHERADLDVVGADRRASQPPSSARAGDRQHVRADARGCRRPSSRASARGPGRAARRRRCRSRSSPGVSAAAMQRVLGRHDGRLVHEDLARAQAAVGRGRARCRARARSARRARGTRRGAGRGAGGR